MLFTTVSEYELTIFGLYLEIAIANINIEIAFSLYYLHRFVFFKNYNRSDRMY